MGNRKLRAEVARQLKAKGYGKLYVGPKRSAFRRLSAPVLRQILFLLELKPGDLVNDCDYFNHVVKVPSIPEWTFGQRSRVKSFFMSPPVEFEDGRGCGCPWSPVPPFSVSEIRRSLTDSPESIADAKESGWWSSRCEALQKLLEEGLPICDERGVKLPSVEVP